MKKVINIFLLMISMNAFSNTAQLELYEKTQDFLHTLDKGVLGMDNSINIEFRSIRLRTTLEMGIEIPFIADFKIQPEVELFFVKK